MVDCQRINPDTMIGFASFITNGCDKNSIRISRNAKHTTVKIAIGFAVHNSEGCKVNVNQSLVSIADRVNSHFAFMITLPHVSADEIRRVHR